MAKRKQKTRTGTAVSAPQNTVEIAQPVTKQQKTAEKFRIEYAYVIKDMRTIFILAGIMFTLLIVINLVLR
jgi:hypothetical protein